MQTVFSEPLPATAPPPWLLVGPVARIQRTVARFYCINREQMLTRRGKADVVRPRHVAMYLAKKLTSANLHDIGRRFKVGDHTTVLSAVRKIARLVGDASISQRNNEPLRPEDIDPALVEEVAQIRLLLQE